MSEGRINTYLVILLVGRLSNERKWKTYDAVWTSGQGSRQPPSPCVGQGIGDTPGHRAVKRRGISTADRQPISVDEDSVGGEGVVIVGLK
jgi:hypothetical protein